MHAFFVQKVLIILKWHRKHANFKLGVQYSLKIRNFLFGVKKGSPELQKKMLKWGVDIMKSLVQITLPQPP